MTKFAVVDGELRIQDPLIPGNIDDAIDKWQFVVDHLFEIRAGNFGIRTCSLCLKYYHNGCDECPIFVHTNRRACGGTEYNNFMDAWENEEWGEAEFFAEGMLHLLHSIKANMEAHQ